MVYDRSLSFPSNRSVLYRKALRILLEEWAAEKCLENQRQIYEGLSVELEESLLSEIAAKGFAKDQLFFSQREIVDRIKAFLASNLNAPKHLDGEKVLEAIAVQQGILVKRAEDAYSFSHLTLQEHLTAQYIVNNPENMRSLVRKHLINENWREVFLLIAGLMPGNKGADPLLRLMEAHTQASIATSKLKALLQWAEKVTARSEGNHKSAAKRSMAIFLVLALERNLTRFYTPLDTVCILILCCMRDITHYLDPILNCAVARDLDLNPTDSSNDHHKLTFYDDDFGINPIDDSIIDPKSGRIKVSVSGFVYEIQEAKIFKSVDYASLVRDLEALYRQASEAKYHDEAQYDFNKHVLQLWFDALGLAPGLVRFSEVEAKDCLNYFYANRLMVQCKEAAVRVSPQTWEAIEGRMLTVAAETNG